MGSCICKEHNEGEEEITSKKKKEEAEEEASEESESPEGEKLKSTPKPLTKEELLSTTCEYYNTKIVEVLNEIRSDPKKYAEKILSNIQYIKQEKRKRNNEEKTIPLFTKTVKVVLHQGESRFKEAAEALKKLAPMGELSVKDEIKIPLPNTEGELKGHDYLRSQADIIRKKESINAYFKDFVGDPEVSALLMVVDDAEKFTGKKRNTVLNPDFGNIGVDSKFVGKKFVAHLAFSK